MNNYFLYEKQLYNQLDGFAMGQPIAPILANIFYVIMKENGSIKC